VHAGRQPCQPALTQPNLFSPFARVGRPASNHATFGIFLWFEVTKLHLRFRLRLLCFAGWLLGLHLFFFLGLPSVEFSAGLSWRPRRDRASVKTDGTARDRHPRSPCLFPGFCESVLRGSVRIGDRDRASRRRSSPAPGIFLRLDVLQADRGFGCARLFRFHQRGAQTKDSL
jgi:hypothetical protein